MRPRSAARRIALVLFMLAIGCKIPGGDDSGTDPSNGSGKTRDWSFTMALSKNNFTMTQGGTDTVIVTFTRAGGFTGAINLTAFAPPGPGLTVAFESITTTGVVTTSRMIVTLGGSFPIGVGTAVFGLDAQNPDTVVMGQNTTVTINVVRKNGTFINAPQSLSVGRGQSITARISIIRTNYDAAVPVNLVTNIAGLSATFSPNPIAQGDTVAQMTLSAASTTVEGTYSVGVRTSEGLPAQGTAPVTVIVTAPGSFTIGFTNNPLLVPKGSTVPVGMTITRSNFSGAVSLALSGVPGGVTATVPPPSTGGIMSVSFAATTGATAGSYPVTFTASAPGLETQTATLTLNIGN